MSDLSILFAYACLLFSNHCLKKNTLKALILLLAFITIILLSTKAQNDTAILLREIQVSSSKLTFHIGLKEGSVDSSLLIIYQQHSLSELLNDNSSINLKNYGSGGLSTMSLRGGSAYQTIVLWNGFSLASPLHGLTDLLLENIFLFNSISIQYGSTTALWGSGAISGTIHLNESSDFNSGLKVNVGFSAGSFSNYKQFAGISLGGKKYSGSFKIYNLNNKNNFTYKNEDSNSEEEQIHSRIIQNGFLSDNYLQTGHKSVLNFRVWYSFSDRQIPPALYQVNTESKQKDINTRFSAEWKQINNQYEFNVRTAYFIETVNFQDEFLNEPSDNKCKSSISEISILRNISSNHRIQIGINQTYSFADSSSNLSNEYIYRTAFFSLYRYIPNNKKSEYSLSVRQEFGSQNNSPFIVAGGANFIPIKSILIRLACSTHYRNPTMNDLFWNPGGNSSLKPESGFSLETGFRVKALELLKLSDEKSPSSFFIDATVYYKKIKDWIIWYPSQSSVWKPQNLLVVESRGTELHLVYKYSKNNFSTKINFEYSFTLSTNEKSLLANDASLHSQLIYAPTSHWNLTAFIYYQSFSLYISHSYTGLSYTSTDNSSWLPAFFILFILFDYYY